MLSAGGAFSLPPRPDYFPFLHAIQKVGSASLGKFSVALMEHGEQLLSRGHRTTVSCPYADNFADSDDA